MIKGLVFSWSYIFWYWLIPFFWIIEFKINIINYTSKIKVFMLYNISNWKFGFLNTHVTKYGYLNKKINKKISKFFYYVNIFAVNKSFIKFITDFGPLLVFFSFYYKNEKNLIVAIPPFIVATLIALIVVWILEKKNSNGAIIGRNIYNFFWVTNYIF